MREKTFNIKFLEIQYRIISMSNIMGGKYDY